MAVKIGTIGDATGDANASIGCDGPNIDGDANDDSPTIVCVRTPFDDDDVDGCDKCDDGENGTDIADNGNDGDGNSDSGSDVDVDDEDGGDNDAVDATIVDGFIDNGTVRITSAFMIASGIGKRIWEIVSDIISNAEKRAQKSQ